MSVTHYLTTSDGLRIYYHPDKYDILEEYVGTYKDEDGLEARRITQVLKRGNGNDTTTIYLGNFRDLELAYDNQINFARAMGE